LPRSEDRELRLSWSRRFSLRQRILAVNIFAIIILAGSLFYLDSFRGRLTQARADQAQAEAVMISHMLALLPPASRQPAMIQLGQDSRTRLRLYDSSGAKLADSWQGAPPTYEMRDPDTEPWYRGIARALDNGFDAIVGARRPPVFEEPGRDRLESWAEARTALVRRAATTEVRRAPEGTPYISSAAPVGGEGKVLLLTVNARDIRRVVRSERLTLILILAGTIILSILLSRFLARTIAYPLRRLAIAAHRVRLGRAREVDVPLLPARRDEIGLLARALHDMSQSLRQRIDATEAFAADVTHELKNPLASLRSAVDTLEKVEDPSLRQQMIDLLRDDVARLDRLVVDIAEASRLDAELSRARFEPVDVGKLIESMIAMWEGRSAAQIAFARPRAGTAMVMGEESRLARLLDNLVDNAISFSPPGGVVEIRAAGTGGEVMISVEDQGPGIPSDQRDAIFNRFHSIRPEEDFGRHSGLGLAIARAIAEGHGGRIEVEDRPAGRSGARFVVHLPGAGL
jgi:two-component system, OmpR family, sensor histidine kinase ChvG